MNTYKGIPISEGRLLANSIIFTLIFIGLTVAFAFLVYTSLTAKSPKERQRIRKLRERAQYDDLAKKQLEKTERRARRRKKRNKGNVIFDVVICGIVICVAFAILVWGVIPGWTDYIKKDYVVYTGEITVCVQLRQSRIELEDGTTVWGRADFDTEDTYGTVVYSRRTKRILGGSK